MKLGSADVFGEPEGTSWLPATEPLGIDRGGIVQETSTGLEGVDERDALLTANVAQVAAGGDQWNGGSGAMLFWTRAGLCVGAVTLLAIQRLPSEPTPIPAAVTRWPIDRASAACRAHPDACAAAIAHGWQVVMPPVSSPSGDRRKPVHGDGAAPKPVAIAGRSLT